MTSYVKQRAWKERTGFEKSEKRRQYKAAWIRRRRQEQRQSALKPNDRSNPSVVFTPIYQEIEPGDLRPGDYVSLWDWIDDYCEVISPVENAHIHALIRERGDRVQVLEVGVMLTLDADPIISMSGEKLRRLRRYCKKGYRLIQESPTAPEAPLSDSNPTPKPGDEVEVRMLLFGKVQPVRGRVVVGSTLSSACPWPRRPYPQVDLVRIPYDAPGTVTVAWEHQGVSGLTSFPIELRN